MLDELQQHLIETLALAHEVISAAWPVLHDPPRTTDESAAQIALARIERALCELGAPPQADDVQQDE